MELGVIRLTDTERQVACALTHLWNLKKLISHQLKVEWSLPETGDNRREEKMGKIDEWLLSYS
jgi:hypothetical protein